MSLTNKVQVEDLLLVNDILFQKCVSKSDVISIDNVIMTLEKMSRHCAEKIRWNNHDSNNSSSNNNNNSHSQVRIRSTKEVENLDLTKEMESWMNQQYQLNAAQAFFQKE